jgi:hypothetical protein
MRAEVLCGGANLHIAHAHKKEKRRPSLSVRGDTKPASRNDAFHDSRSMTVTTELLFKFR